MNGSAEEIKRMAQQAAAEVAAAEAKRLLVSEAGAIAEDAAERVVRKLSLLLGVDFNEPESLANFRKTLEHAELTRLGQLAFKKKLKDAGWAAIGIGLTAFLYAAWDTIVEVAKFLSHRGPT